MVYERRACSASQPWKSSCLERPGWRHRAGDYDEKRMPTQLDPRAGLSAWMACVLRSDPDDPSSSSEIEDGELRISGSIIQRPRNGGSAIRD